MKSLLSALHLAFATGLIFLAISCLAIGGQNLKPWHMFAIAFAFFVGVRWLADWFIAELVERLQGKNEPDQKRRVIIG